MKLDEVTITKAIVERYFENLMDNLEIDVAIVGGGPSGLVAGYFLAQAGHRVALYEEETQCRWRDVGRECCLMK